MENKKRLPKSVRKYIRLQKAFIRKSFFDTKKQEELISDLYKKNTQGIIDKEIKGGEPLKFLGYRPLGHNSTGKLTGEIKKKIKGKLSKKISKESRENH